MAKGVFACRSSALPWRLAGAWFTVPAAAVILCLGFAAPDHLQALTINPSLGYSSYLGGSGLDVVQAVAVDGAGNIYVAGYTNSADFPLAGAAQPALGGGTCGTSADPFPCPDAFVAKFDPTGTILIYATYLGGSGEDYGVALAVDPATGEAYVAGHTNSHDFPVVGAFQVASGGGVDAFVAKISADGARVEYATYLGGSGDDFGQGIAVSGGRAVVAGFTASPNFPTTAGAAQPFFGGVYDAFVARISADGSGLEFSTYLGGSGQDLAFGVVVDSQGRAHVAGWTDSGDFPTVSALQSTLKAGTCGSSLNPFPCPDAFVSQLSEAGSALTYSTYFGGSHADYAFGIALDGEGAVYLTGQTTSTDLPVTPEAFQTSGGGTTVDAFVSKLSPVSGELAYSTYLGGLGADSGLAIAVDGQGDAYVAGSTHGGGFPVSYPVQAESGGFFDAFLAKVNPAGTALIFSTYLGGSGNERARAAAVGAAGNAWVAGETFSTDFPLTDDALQPAYGGGSFEGFVSRFADLGRPVVSPRELSHVFADQEIGTVSEPLDVKLENRGDAALLVGNSVVEGDYGQTNDCPASLAGGESCTVSITFTPSDFGVRAGRVAIEHNAEGSPFVVNLAGNGIAAPSVRLSTTSLDFGEVPLGATSAPQSVEISNGGQAELVFSSISASGDFSASHTCGAPVAVDGGCSISVTFSPQTPWVHVQTLTLVDNAPGSPHVVTLTGTGLGPEMSVEPAKVDFGSQPVGSSTSPTTIRVANTGNEPLEITDIRATGDFSQTNACGTALPPGGECTLNITFIPSFPGEHRGSVDILNSSPEDSKSVALAGLGADFALTAAQKTLSVTAGQSATMSLTLTPLYGFVGEVSLACVGAPLLSTCTVEPAKVALNGTGEVTTTLTVQTTAASLAPPRHRVQRWPALLNGIGRVSALSMALAVWILAALSLRRRRSIPFAAAVLSAFLWASCGGGAVAPPPPAPSQPGTPIGTYTLTVEASFGARAHSETITLTVR
jgi:hypothetical protein